MHQGDDHVNRETPLQDLLAKEVKQELMAAIQQLPEADGELVLLHYFLEWSLADIAVLKDMTYSQTKNRLYRIRKSLKEALGDETDGGF